MNTFSNKTHPLRLKKPRPAITRQLDLMKSIFYRKEAGYESLFGIEWIFNLFLVSVQFVFPTLYIRHFFGTTLIKRKKALEYWAVGKLVFLAFLLSSSIFNNFTFFLSIFFLLDLYLYILGLVFLEKFYSNGVSKSRNIFLLQLNFIESNIAFAILYMCKESLSFGSALSTAPTWLDALYFSFVTSATIGYGDITSNARSIVIAQIVASFLFISVVLTTFLNKDESSFEKRTNL